jgi:G3E family GTPase
MNHGKTPVTVITGFLGAGKTTLVNKLLQAYSGNMGVIVNEFGEVGIDGEIIYADDKALIEIRNGCVCCTVRTDLITGVKDLLSRADLKIDRLIVETSGLADPAPVLQTFLADAEIMRIAELESVVTVVDVASFQRHANDEIAAEQIAFADMIVLTKTELVESSLVESLNNSLRSANPYAFIVDINKVSDLSDAIFGARRFSLPTLLTIEPGILEDEHDHEHDQSIQSVSLETHRALNADLFSKWATKVSLQSEQSIMRMKGVLEFYQEARQFYFHSVYMLTECKPGKPWLSDTQRTSRLVVIGRNLDVAGLRAGFESCMYQLECHI